MTTPVENTQANVKPFKAATQAAIDCRNNLKQVVNAPGVVLDGVGELLLDGNVSGGTKKIIKGISDIPVGAAKAVASFVESQAKSFEYAVDSFKNSNMEEFLQE